MADLNRLPLSGLRAVEVVARRGSLGAAAMELGVTPGAVSQQVLRVERIFGASLFERGPAGMTPTALGAEVARDLSAGFARIAAAVGRGFDRSEARLTLSVPPLFGARWLVHRLAGFTAAQPGVQVRLQAESDFVNPDASDVDLCIRIGRGNWPGVTAERLFEHRLFPVCSVRDAARLKVPADLAGMPAIRDAHAMVDWSMWLDAEGLSEEILGEGPVFSDAGLCMDSAMSGAGVFLAWETLAHDQLAIGNLAEPFPGRRRASGFSYWLISGAEGPRTAPQRAFRRWLKKELAASGLDG
ncbi:LysR substrate-binding domain-containing protein [Tropicimonas sp. IMCC6043]|uniref:LysR substrate-binding domain-containing protein n=1 Tax=Tropicimonas sp. IMCC6043 TaxID=2510645 RepID=UPI00101BE1B1|nr:LysR substrate-binding domain-containing protein [Tropicimonas sp. IMCC6043]RYH08340.1 LysR family transcriptional regulator [Tropicimonas sp. IMCC6043]